MNRFLIVFLLVLLTEAAILTGLKHWWYSNPLHVAPDPSNSMAGGAMWYGLPENDTSVSKHH